jgi:hypothetical protein
LIVSIALLLLPDFLLIAGGTLLKRLPGFGADFWSGVERLVYFVLFPALLFRSLATSPLALGDATSLAAVGLAFTGAGMLLAGLAPLLFRLPQSAFAACFQCGFRFNTYIALAIASRVAGAPGLAAISLLVGVLVPVVNLAAVGMLARGGETGIAWKLAGVPLPAPITHILELLAGAALPLGLLAVGAGLTLARSALPLPAFLWWNGVKLVALPAIALALSTIAGLSSVEREIAIVMAAVPTAPSAYILATRMKSDGASVAALISSGTVLAAITLPLWIAWTG